MGKIIKGVYTGYFNSGIKIVIGFFLTPFIIGKLGMEGFALFVLLAGAVEILRLFDLGNSGALLILVSRSDKKNSKAINEFFNTSFFLQLGLFAIVLFLGVVLSFILPDFYKLDINNSYSISFLIIGLSISVAINIISNIFGVILQSFNKLAISNNIRTCAYLIQVLSIVYFLWMGWGLLSLMIGYLFSAIFSLLVTIIFFFRIGNMKLGFKYFSKKILKNEYLHLLFWLSLGSINLFLLHRIDIVIVGKIVAVEMVALLSISKRLYSLFESFTNQLTNNLRPSFGEALGGGDLLSAFSLFKLLSYISFAFVTILSISLFSVNENFISWWVGEEFYIGEFAEFGLLISLIITTYVLPFKAILSSAKIVKPVSIARMIQGIIRLGLAIILGKLYGISGIIYSVFLSSLFISFWYLPYLVYKNINFEGFSSFFIEYSIRIILYLFIALSGAFIAKYNIDQPFAILFIICFLFNAFVAFILMVDAETKLFIKNYSYKIINLYQ